MDETSTSSSSSSDFPRRTWANLLPLKLQLAADNVSSPVRPQPLYILVSRQGFLSTVASQAWPHFQHVLPNIPGQQGLRPWFDHQQLPLRGNIPIGVLYDLFVHNASGDLPWELTIHFTGMPDTLTNWHNGLPMTTQFFHSLKEACFICRGPDGAAAVMKMTGATQDAMWSAIERSEAAKYQAALTALKVAPIERQGAAPAVPVRLFVRTAPAVEPGAAGAGGWEEVFSSSRPVAAVRPDGSWTTLGQMLEVLLPGLRFVAPMEEVLRMGVERGVGEGGAAAGAEKEKEDVGELGTGAEGVGGECVPGSTAGESVATSTSTAAEGEDAGGPLDAAAGSAEGGAGVPGPAAAAEHAAAATPLHASTLTMSMFGTLPKLGPSVPASTAGCSCEAVVSGVVPPLATPVAWLHSNLHAPDYFLYIVVKRASELAARGGLAG